MNLSILSLFCFHFACTAVYYTGASERIAGRRHVVDNDRQADANPLLFLFKVFVGSSIEIDTLG